MHSHTPAHRLNGALETQRLVTYFKKVRTRVLSLVGKIRSVLHLSFQEPTHFDIVSLVLEQ